jgi:N-methylhydantoinase B
MTIDPITLELIAQGFIAIVREMRATMLKTAYSNVIKEGRDFSCALLDGAGQILGQSEDSPAHIIPLSWQVQHILRTRTEPLRPGDVLMVNDPYTGGTHLNDVALIQPIFFSGQQAFMSVVRAHWGDIGGLAPGSIAGAVDDIIHEGLRFPPVLVYEQGKINQGMLDVIWANVRVVPDRIGDFFACYSTCRIGERRLNELAQRRGEALIIAAASALLDRTEERMRKRIAEIPPGTYRFEDYIDSDGRTTTRPLFLPVTVTVSGSSITADFTGASPQGPGPMNCSLAAASTGAFIACKGLLDPTGPINQGAFRPITVTAPERSFINAQYPAACGGFSEIRRRVTSATIGALARAVPLSLVGDGKGSSNHVNIGCTNPARGGLSILYEYPSGGTGAFREADGSNTCRHFDEGEFGSIQPIEVIEAEHPLRVERCTLREDSEGVGFRRGGLGMRREIRIVGEEAKLSILSDRIAIPPFGVLGGSSPQPNDFHVRRKGKVIYPSEAPGKVTAFGLQTDDIFVALSAGGGGYGDPLEREPERVCRDVRKRYISLAQARDRYGVIVSAEGALDEAATAQQREKLRAAEVRVEVKAGKEDVFSERRRIVEIDAKVAAASQLADGDIAELLSKGGAPLRVWIKTSAGHAGIALGPVAREILGIRAGETVVIRSPLQGPPKPNAARP